MKNDEDNGPVLPPKDTGEKMRGSTVYLPQRMWNALDAITKENPDYSRNEVIQSFLADRIRAYMKQRGQAQTKK